MRPDIDTPYTPPTPHPPPWWPGVRGGWGVSRGLSIGGGMDKSGPNEGSWRGPIGGVCKGHEEPGVNDRAPRGRLGPTVGKRLETSYHADGGGST